MNNSLAEVHPELVSEWSEKNLMLTPDDITFGIIGAHFGEYGIFDSVEVFKNVKKADIEARLLNMMNEQYSALSVVKQGEE